MHTCILYKTLKFEFKMARITITMPDNLHTQVLKLAKKEDGSVFPIRYQS